MKKFTKILALLLAFSLIFAMAGCSLFEVEEEEKPAAGSKPIEQGAIKVGVLHISSIDETSGYTFAHQSGIKEMQKNIGLKDEQIVIKDEIDDTDVPKTKAALTELVEAGCNIIFATSFNYMDSVEEFAAKYPDIIFSHCSGNKSAANFSNYFGRIYEARYLSGIAAGLKAKELSDKTGAANRIGYVAAMGIGMAEVSGGINAFALGAQSVNSEVEVKVSVTGSWFDPTGEADAAKALIDAGCTVIGQHCDTNMPQKKAEENNVFGCGYNSDMTAGAPKAHLTAPIWNWGVYYTYAVKSAIAGTWKTEAYFEGMTVGLVDISPLNESVAAPGTKDAIEAARAKILNGELIIFDAGIVKAYQNDNGKAVAVPENEATITKALTDTEIAFGIDFYVKGVSLL